MNTENSPDKYKEILGEIKKEKMDWDFDDFLKQAEQKPLAEEKIIPIAKKGKPFPSKIFWLAASLVLVAGLLFLIKNTNESSLQKQNEIVKNEILKQKSQDENQFLLSHNEAQNADSLQRSEKDSLVQSIKPDAEAQKIMNKILPKRGRIKRTTKQRYTENKNKETEKQRQEISQYQENFVMINGQKIENENEAMDVARYSLQLLSDQVTQTVAKTEPITDFVEF